MLRIKLAGGRASPAGLRAIGEISNPYGRGEGELSTRQNVQLHYLELGALPKVFDHLHAAGLTSAGGCGDAVRNITGCPVAGLGGNELFDTQPARRRDGGVLLRQPGLLGPAAQAQDHDRGLRRPLQRARDQLHRADRRRPRGRRGLRRPGRRRPLVGPADRARPRRLRPEGGGAGGDAGAAGRLEGGPHLPGLARQVADEVHGRRLRPGRNARRGRAADRPPARRLRAAGARPVPRPHRRPPAAAAGALHRRRAGAPRAGVPAIR